jgi:hypothetical protein
MGTKSRESIYGASIRAAAERAAEAREKADCLACEAWNKRMLGFKDRRSLLRCWAMPSMPGTSICLGCNTHQTVALNIVRRPGLLAASRAGVQAEPSGGAATDEDFRRRSCVNMVAGRAMSDFSTCQPDRPIRSRLGLILYKLLVFPSAAASTPPYLSKNEFPRD